MINNRNKLRTAYTQRSGNPISHINYPYLYESMRQKQIHFIIPNCQLTSSICSSQLSPKNNCHSFRNNLPINSNIINNNNINQTQMNKTCNLPFHYNVPISPNSFNLFQQTIHQNKINFPSRYSLQLTDLRKQLQNLKQNFKKHQNKNINTIKNEEIISFKKRQTLQNQLCLSFTNTQKTNQQTNNKQINLLKQLKNNSKEQDNSQFDQKQIVSIKVQQNNKNQTQYAQKIDLILKKICDLELSERMNIKQLKDQKKYKIQRVETKQYIQRSSMFLIEKINEKIIELKKMEIKYLPTFMKISCKLQQSSINTVSGDHLPQQWKLFQKQLNILLNKFQLVLQDKIEKYSPKKKYMTNEKNELNNVEIKKLIQQNVLKSQQNEILKLQYLKLKNKILTMDQNDLEMQYQIQEYKNCQKNYLNQIQRLQELIEGQNQKIQIMNIIKEKKQDIQKQFHRIFNQLNKQIIEKESIIIELKKKLNVNQKQIIKKNDDCQIELKNYMNKIQIEKYQFSQTISQINQRLSTKIQHLQHSRKKSLHNKIKNTYLGQLIHQIGYLFKLQCKDEQQILKEVISKMKEQNYIEKAQYYSQVIKTFGIKYENSNYHKLLMKSIQNFHKDLKLLLLKVQQMTDENQKKQFQLKNINCELKNCHFKLKQSEQRIASSKSFLEIQKSNHYQQNILLTSTLNNSILNQSKLKNQQKNQ